MTTPHVKENWDDSSESEQEEEIVDIIVDDDNVNIHNDSDKNNNKYDDEGEWDFYEGYTSCINCGKSSETRIIMIESKRVFCYNACLGNDDDDDGGYDDYDDYDDYDLDDYDKKLGLSVSCR